MRLSKLNQDLFDRLYLNIIEFRETFDLPVNSPSSLDEKADTLHTSLAIEELTELGEASSRVEQADAIVDTIYVLMGRLVHLGHFRLDSNIAISYLIDLLLNIANNLNIDFMACWDEVHASNMSKVCQSQAEFDATQEHYAKEGIKLTAVKKGHYLIAKCAEDVVSGSKTIRQGKVLKSVHYRPAKLAALVSV